MFYGNISLIWIWNHIEVVKKVVFGEVVGGVIIWALGTQYRVTRLYSKKFKNMTSSKWVCTHHHIYSFLRKYLVIKIDPYAGQAPGTTADVGKNEILMSLKDGGIWLLHCHIFSLFYWNLSYDWFKALVPASSFKILILSSVINWRPSVKFTWDFKTSYVRNSHHSGKSQIICR